MNCSSKDNKDIIVRVFGDDKNGYYPAIFYKDIQLTDQSQLGDFSICIRNREGSVKQELLNWKGNRWAEDEEHVCIFGEIITDFDMKISVTLEYQIIESAIIKKTIRLYQCDMPKLYYRLSIPWMPYDKPESFWSFEQVDNRGGHFIEQFPAAGWRRTDGLSIGLLTDAGFRNKYTRAFRRRAVPSEEACQVSLREIPDGRLYQIPSYKLPREKQYITQNFGELLHIDHTSTPRILDTDPGSDWIGVYGSFVETVAEGFIIHSGKPHRGIPLGAYFPLPLEEDFHTLRFTHSCPSKLKLSLHLLDEKGNPVKNLGWLFKEVTSYPDSFKKFEYTFFSETNSNPALRPGLFIGMAEYEGEEKCQIEIHDFTLTRHQTEIDCYNVLSQGEEDCKTLFLFADPSLKKDERDYRLASQVYLAEGLGFTGSIPEKVFYSTLMMLTWITSPDDFTPHNVPSLHYSPDMYNRDSVYSIIASNDKELNEKIYQRWGQSQDDAGWIGMIISPEMGCTERETNEASPEWLMWGLLNRRRFGTHLDEEKLKKAATACLKTFDPLGTGICRAKKVMGQNDILNFPDYSSELSVNQGVWALTLKIIKALEIDGISEKIAPDRIARAVEEYRSYYDEEKQRFLSRKKVRDVVSLSDFRPEFLSLWLFDEPMLTDSMVTSTLNQIPRMLPLEGAPIPEEGLKGTVCPLVIRLTEDEKGWSYFSDTYHPVMDEHFGKTYGGHEADGIYYNGGSWLRNEIIAYGVGSLHNWKPGIDRIKNRLWAELELHPHWPTSHEYQPTDPTRPYWGTHLVFSWNVFSLIVLEKLGLRKTPRDKAGIT